MTSRLSTRLADLRAHNRAGFIAYVMAGDPDVETSWEVLRQLPDAGVDVVELGMPFSDPTADGPSIQRAGQRALASGTRLNDVFELARRFRALHPETPLILMGYTNSAHARGYEVFANDAAAAGVDGAIIVDAPPEEDAPIRAAFAAYDLALVRLATPTSDAARLPRIVENATGFVYYVSVTGVTGSAAATDAAVRAGVERIRAVCDLPVAVGFGVRAQEQASAIARHADAVVVGSAIVDALADGGVSDALATARRLAEATHTAR